MSFRPFTIVSSFAWIVSLAAVSAQASGDTYEVDAVHSSVAFGIKHSDLNSVYGIFSDLKGRFSLEEGGQIDVSIGVESINSGNEGRDKHLKSPDFFSARQFPRITFKGKTTKKLDDRTLEVVGEVTMRGVSKPVTAKVSMATGKGRGGEERGGLETVFVVKRSDFKLGGPGGIGDEVKVIVSLQGVKK